MALGIFGALTKLKSAANDLPYTSQVALGLFGQCNAQASKVAHWENNVSKQRFLFYFKLSKRPQNGENEENGRGALSVHLPSSPAYSTADVQIAGEREKLQFVGESSNECKESVTKMVLIMTTPITYTKKL